jgi:hypothetical protein
MVSMAGGRGGHAYGRPNNNCAPWRLVQTAGWYGQTATTPMLWVYTANDSYFAPRIAKGLHNEFTRQGGKAHLAQLSAFGGDGHSLFFGRGGWRRWGPLMQAYIASAPEP